MSAPARAVRRIAVIVVVAALLAGCEKDWEFGGAYDLTADAACNTTNPLTGACSCPADFTTLNLSDAGITVCWSDESDAGWEWGGAFDLTGTTCTTANPRTGDCTCESGYTQLYLAEADMTFCWAQNGTQAGLPFGGAYDLDAAGGCNTANPRQEDCSCPDRFVALDLGEAGFTLCRGE